MMRFIFLLAVVCGVSCMGKKKATNAVPTPVDRDTGLFDEGDLDDLPEADIK